MTLAAHSVEVGTARAALIDPPLGMVTIELEQEDIRLVFTDGECDRVPRSAVRALKRDDFEVTAHWAGTPVVLGFDSLHESARMFDELGGFENDERTFIFLVDELDEAQDLSKPVEPRLATYVRKAALGLVIVLALMASFGMGAALGG